jgi:hypothetical protein
MCCEADGKNDVEYCFCGLVDDDDDDDDDFANADDNAVAGENTLTVR